jgi:hypothetical protein
MRTNRRPTPERVGLRLITALDAGNGQLPPKLACRPALPYTDRQSDIFDNLPIFRYFLLAIASIGSPKSETFRPATDFKLTGPIQLQRKMP